MEATVQMNTRLGRSAKAEGDAVLARLGYTPSQAVRALWGYLREHRDVPAFMKEPEIDTVQAERERKLALIEDGTGLAVTIAQRDCGYTGPTSTMLEDTTWHELRDDMYDGMIEDMEARCGF